MRHNSKKFTLGRKKEQRKALMRNLAESLVIHGGIRTTKAKAKALRTVIEPVITKAGRGSLADRKAVNKVLFTKSSIQKMMTEIGPHYKERQGGYTRIVKLGHRKNDAAEMVRIELV
ncbi:MAG: 50S ribosomal protein L17 [Candidatus Magasanikbacteria bacterium]|jgi:large subunit ribosomal protein L17|nr:50S ribosomal protein L17 [Candidatus Magasanikbacteria bacterium]